MEKSEQEFADYLDSKDLYWKSQPKTFRKKKFNYRPDFYCFDNDTYYEVKTHLPLKEAKKLLLFKEYFPNIKLKIVSPNGCPYYSRSSGAYLEKLFDNLNFILTHDILDVNEKEVEDKIKNFSVFYVGKSYWNSSKKRTIYCSSEMIRKITKEKEKLEEKLSDK